MSFVKNALFLLFASSLMVSGAENLVTLKFTPRDENANQSAPMDFISRTKLLLKINSELKKTSWIESEAKFTGKKSITFSYDSKKASEKEVKALFSTASLTIHKRHSDNDSLVEKIAKGEVKIPEGYRLYKQKVKDSDGKAQGTRNLLITEKPALTEKDIKVAWPDRSSNTMIFIELHDAGAKKMEAFTKPLKPGKGVIVTILGGEVINAATLQADILSKNFAISGLDNIKECETIAEKITPRFDYNIKVLSIKSVEPSAKPTK